MCVLNSNKSLSFFRKGIRRGQKQGELFLGRNNSLYAYKFEYLFRIALVAIQKEPANFSVEPVFEVGEVMQNHVIDDLLPKRLYSVNKIVNGASGKRFHSVYYSPEDC